MAVFGSVRIVCEFLSLLRNQDLMPFILLRRVWR